MKSNKDMSYNESLHITMETGMYNSMVHDEEASILKRNQISQKTLKVGNMLGSGSDTVYRGVSNRKDSLGVDFQRFGQGGPIGNLRADNRKRTMSIKIKVPTQPKSKNIELLNTKYTSANGPKFIKHLNSTHLTNFIAFKKPENNSSNQTGLNGTTKSTLGNPKSISIQPGANNTNVQKSDNSNSKLGILANRKFELKPIIISKDQREDIYSPTRGQHPINTGQLISTIEGDDIEAENAEFMLSKIAEQSKNDGIASPIRKSFSNLFILKKCESREDVTYGGFKH